MRNFIRQNYLNILIILVGASLSAAIVIDYNNTTKAFLQTDVENPELITEPINPDTDLIRGAPVPEVFYIVEYGDLQCPYCKEFHPEIKSLLQTELGTSGKISWVFRHSPHLGDISIEKAEIAECVREVEGEFIGWEFIDESLKVVDEVIFPIDRYNTLFDTKGWAKGAINNCFNHRRTKQKILKSINTASEYKIDRTPYLQFVTTNGELLFEHTGVLNLLELKNITDNILLITN